MLNVCIFTNNCLSLWFHYLLWCCRCVTELIYNLQCFLIYSHIYMTSYSVFCHSLHSWQNPYLLLQSFPDLRGWKSVFATRATMKNSVISSLVIFFWPSLRSCQKKITGKKNTVFRPRDEITIPSFLLAKLLYTLGRVDRTTKKRGYGNWDWVICVSRSYFWR